MRSLLLLSASLALTGAVIGNAYYQKSQFYPSVVYLTKSNPSMAVLYIQAFVFVLMMAKVMRKIFFGELRPAEMEHLIERSWYAVTETCLAFTVFRDDFSPRFVASFTLLLFLKCFHWLVEDRVDYMERSPVITFLFHLRVLSLLGVLGVLDMYFVNHAYYSTLVKGASVQLVFGFEYAILMTAVLMAFLKYVLHTVDMQNENPWENKAVYLLYTELVMGFIRVVLYFSFMALMIKVHTFPLFAIRPMYLSMRSFKKALHDVIMSRRAIHNMNTLYPDASPEELAATDNVCIICREDMETACKKLPCNHIFHTNCLRSWFQRQQTCPTCRMDVLRMPRPPAAAATPQPPVQPIPPPQPPLNAVFPGYPYVWPPPMPQPAAAPASTSAPTASTPAGTSAAASTVPPTSSGAEQFLGAQYMPFMSADAGFPHPPLPLGSLSEESLRLLEGQERANVEARVQWLQDIQALLDGAMVLIQQYNMAASQARFQEINLTTQGQYQPPPAATPSGDGASGTAKQNPETPAASTAGQAEDIGQATGVSSGQAQSSTEAQIPSWEDPQQEEHEDEMHEIRRRRLHRFSSSGPANQQPTEDSDKEN